MRSDGSLARQLRMAKSSLCRQRCAKGFSMSSTFSCAVSRLSCIWAFRFSLRQEVAEHIQFRGPEGTTCTTVDPALRLVPYPVSGLRILQPFLCVLLAFLCIYLVAPRDSFHPLSDPTLIRFCTVLSSRNNAWGRQSTKDVLQPFSSRVPGVV